jgi:hypothetical protein
MAYRLGFAGRLPNVATVLPGRPTGRDSPNVGTA